MLQACFHGVDDTGTVIFTALNFLTVGAAKSAFDFTNMVKDAGAQAKAIAGKSAAAMKAPGGGGGGGGHGAGGHGSGGQHGASHGANGPQHSGPTAPKVASSTAGASSVSSKGDLRTAGFALFPISIKTLPVFCVAVLGCRFVCLPQWLV